MTEKYQLKLRHQGLATVVGFEETVILDTYHIDAISLNLFALIEKEGRVRLAIDLSAIRMISSQTLGVFIKLKHLAEEHKGDVVFCGIDPKLYKVFKITGLDRIFQFFGSSNEAVEFLEKAGQPQDGPKS